MTEIRAGTASFLTMSYLLLVNPVILSESGISYDNALFATAMSSAVSSAIVGIFGNLPFGFAPGIGLSAYLTYGLVLSGITTLSESLITCFMSGIILCLFVMTGITDIIMKIVPKSIKHAIVVGMGIFIAMIGMVTINLIVGQQDTLVTLGDLSKLDLQLCCVGVIIVGSLVYHDVKGGILIGIVVMTIIFWCLDSKLVPEMVIDVPKIDFNVDFDVDCLWDWNRMSVIYPATITFLFICIFDISGVMFGLSTLAGIMQENQVIPNAHWGFYASCVGTIVAAILGSTPIICTVESASGVKEGGRTGLTAVVIAFYFVISCFLAPLSGSVPAEATAPVLILVGVMMMGESAKINWDNMMDALPSFLTIIMMPLTYSITNGILFGLVSAAAFYITSGLVIDDIKKLLRRLDEHDETKISVKSIKENCEEGLDEQKNLLSHSLDEIKTCYLTCDNNQHNS